MENQNGKVEIDCSIEDLCCGQFYSGHGHAFAPDNLIGCLEFSPYVNKDMTNQGIEDAILEGVNALDWSDKLHALNITDKQLRDAVRVERGPGDTEAKPFKNMLLDPEVQLFGYIHFYTQIEQSTIITENGIFKGTTDNLKLFGCTHFYA